MVAMAKERTSHNALALPAAVHAAAAITRLASATQRQPNAILLIGEGSVPRWPCRAHNCTISGVKIKIMSAFKARNQDGETPHFQNVRASERQDKSTPPTSRG